MNVLVAGYVAGEQPLAVDGGPLAATVRVVSRSTLSARPE
jgi:hypothetical protein